MSNAIARILFATASLMLTGTLAVASASATEPTVRQVTVSYADLNLAHPAGRATLDRRLHAAADSVCVDTASRLEAASCRSAALVKARTAEQRAVSIAL